MTLSNEINRSASQASEAYIFGYGSLVNLESAAKTLGRQVRKTEVLLGNVQDFFRVWRVVIPVTVQGYEAGHANAVFLDIKRSKGDTVNGILIRVSIDELKCLDIREKYYERIDITGLFYPLIEKANIYTYQGKTPFFVENFTHPKVLAEYEKIVQDGLVFWGPEFSYHFRRSTESHGFDVINGAYKFDDDEINSLTGHD